MPYLDDSATAGQPPPSPGLFLPPTPGLPDLPSESTSNRSGSAASEGNPRSGSNASLVSSIKDPSWTRRNTDAPIDESSVYYDCNLNRVPAAGKAESSTYVEHNPAGKADSPTYVEHTPANPRVVFEPTYVAQSSPASATEDHGDGGRGTAVAPDRTASVSSHISLYGSVAPPSTSGARGRSVSNCSPIVAPPTYINQPGRFLFSLLASAASYCASRAPPLTPPP
jgi:hypothetical protein